MLSGLAVTRQKIVITKEAETQLCEHKDSLHLIPWDYISKRIKTPPCNEASGEREDL